MADSGQKSLSESITNSSVEDFDIYCQPCSFESNHIAGAGYCKICEEHLCKTCLSVHQKQSATRKHVILDEEHMPKSQNKGQSVCSEWCDIHVKETVRFYCRVHDDVGCAECMLFGHRYCKVCLVSDVSDTLRNGIDLNDVNVKIHIFGFELIQRKCSLKISEKAILETHLKILNEIKGFRKEITDYFDQIEADIISDANNVKAENEKTVKIMREEFQSLENEIKDLSRTIKARTDESGDLFVIAKQAKSRLEESEKTLKRMESENELKQYCFQRNEEIRRLCTENITIYTHIKMPHTASKQAIPTKEENSEKVDDIAATFVERISVNDNTSFMGSRCISDFTILDCGIVVLADSLNRKIIVLDNKHTIIRYLTLTARPWGITSTGPNQVAVTLPDEKTIQFIEIEDYEYDLVTEGSLYIGEECYAVVHVAGRLAVSSVNPGRIQLLTREGQFVWQVVTGGMPKYIAASPNCDYLYVSDYETNTVSKMSLDGEITCVSKDRGGNSSYGLTVVFDLVLATHHGGSRVDIMSSDCILLKTLLSVSDKCHKPMALAYCKKQNELFMTTNNGADIDVYHVELLINNQYVLSS